MRIRTILCLLALFGSVTALRAQGNGAAAEAASHGMITDALTGLNCRFSLDSGSYAVEFNKRSIRLVRSEAGKKLMLKAAIKGTPSLQALNRYNEKVAVTTRAVHYDKIGAFLESGVDCQLGISPAAIRKFVVRFDKDVAACEAFLAKQPAEIPDPKAGPIAAKKGVKQKVPMTITPNSDDKEMVITFPTNDANWETAWKIIWDMETSGQANRQGFKFLIDDNHPATRTVLFKIKQAYFKPGRQADWIQVLDDAHPSEFYVPYYFRGTRFYDLKNVGAYVGLNAKEGSAISQVLGKPGRVMAELRDTGPTYKYGDVTRRGEELALWANFRAGNYTYMVEFGFRDDGGIFFRHAPTGHNYFDHFDAAHMHGSYWRIGVKIGPEGNNTTNQVFLTRLPADPKDQGNEGKMVVDEITKESFHDWNAQEFTRLRVSNPKYSVVPADKDRPALPISYDLITNQQGIARHARFKDEKFTHHDFWVTRHDCPEKMYVNLGSHFYTLFGTPSKRPRNLDNQNVVLWHSSSALHVPRAEDGIIGGSKIANGQATIYWTTFELRPRNLFVKTPIYRRLP